jgi:hypothetical protein
VTGAALTTSEAHILSLWDEGAALPEISRRTGLAETYVAQVVERYDVTNRVLSASDKMVAAGSAALLAAIQCFHPEVFTRGHP